jgi:SAM-dependent methyltransferase
LTTENALTEVRRWILLTDKWQQFPRLARALRAQAALNGGAWLISEEERARLVQDGDEPAIFAYEPYRVAVAGRSDIRDPITRAVAEQYENWPYPPWTRITVPPASSLRDDVRKIDPDGADAVPDTPQILIAGCGTGREVAFWAVSCPDARITAIDISASSLRYAETRCAALGLHKIEFLQLDLHRATALMRSFDIIACSGVLHHLPDPEHGWAVLLEVLKPRGLMRVMVYSKIARLRISALRSAFPDLINQPIDGDMLREIRRRVITRFPDIAPFLHFYTLSGACDLLAHRHEDPFDVSRLRQVIDRFGLKLLGFQFYGAHRRAQYRKEFPDDPLCRNFLSVAAFEKKHPLTFITMYDIWCRKP